MRLELRLLRLHRPLHLLAQRTLLLEELLEPLNLAVVRRRRLLKLRAQGQQLSINRVLLGQLLLPLRPPLVHRRMTLLQIVIIRRQIDIQSINLLPVRIVHLC